MAFTSDTLADLEATSRLLLSPLAAPDPATWLREAGQAVRRLLHGDGVVLQLPGTDQPYFTDDAPDVVRRLQDYVGGVGPEGVFLTDPVVHLWMQLRRRENREGFTWDLNAHMVGARGHRMTDAPIVGEAVLGSGYRDFGGLYASAAGGEGMIWVLHRERDRIPFGERTVGVLQLLAPAFRAGLDALARLGAHRATLDALSEPVAAFDVDGRPLHRNAALGALLAAEPERSRVEFELARLARALRVAAVGTARDRAPGAAGPVPAEAVAVTARGRYTLRGAVLPVGAHPSGGAYLVSVRAEVAPALPTADDVRARCGLTRREAEVAVLIAEGLRNDAIAERLFVSAHTARRHTEGVMAKLGVSSRAAVAARLLQAT